MPWEVKDFVWPTITDCLSIYPMIGLGMCGIRDLVLDIGLRLLRTHLCACIAVSSICLSVDCKRIKKNVSRFAFERFWFSILISKLIWHQENATPHKCIHHREWSGLIWVPPYVKIYLIQLSRSYAGFIQPTFQPKNFAWLCSAAKHYRHH